MKCIWPMLNYCFQVIDIKRLYFRVNLLNVKSFYRMSTKLKRKYIIYHENNLKRNVHTFNSSYFLIKTKCVSPTHNFKQNKKTCPIIIVYTSIAISKRLVIYYYLIIQIMLNNNWYLNFKPLVHIISGSSRFEADPSLFGRIRP